MAYIDFGVKKNKFGDLGEGEIFGFTIDSETEYWIKTEKIYPCIDSCNSDNWWNAVMLSTGGTGHFSDDDIITIVKNVKMEVII